MEEPREERGTEKEGTEEACLNISYGSDKEVDIFHVLSASDSVRTLSFDCILLGYGRWDLHNLTLVIKGE